MRAMSRPTSPRCALVCNAVSRASSGQCVLRVAGVPDHGAAWLQHRHHVGELVLHRLETADDAVELRALLHEAECLVEHVLRGAERVGCQHHAAGVQHALHRRHWGVGGIQHDRARGFEVRCRRRDEFGRCCGAYAAMLSLAGRTAALPSGRYSSRCVGAPASIAAAAVLPSWLMPTPKRTSPAAMRGSHSSCNASVAPWMKASVAITMLPAKGTNAAAPPSTSAATAASSTPRPAPPKRSGTSSPGRPSSTRLSHNPASKPLPVSECRRSASMLTRSASRPRSESANAVVLR